MVRKATWGVSCYMDNSILFMRARQLADYVGKIGMGLVELASNQCIKIVADYLPKSSYNIDIECDYR